MSGWWKTATTRRSWVIGSWVLALVLLAGAAFASVGIEIPTPEAKVPKVEATEKVKPSESKAAKSESAETEAEDAEDEGVHGGPKPRIHDGCTLASGLEGNWTHGDYVSAVVKANPEDSEKIREAAHSDCGKVDHSQKKNGKSGESHGKSGESHGKSGDHRPEIGAP